MENSGSQFEVLQDYKSVFRAARLETFLPRAVRTKSLLGFSVLTALMFVLAVVGTLSGAGPRFWGLFLMALGPLWFFALAEFYFLATSRPKPFHRAKRKGEEKTVGLDLETAERLIYTRVLKEEQIRLEHLYSFLREHVFDQ